MGRMLRRGLLAAAWLFIAWYLSRAVALSSLSPTTRATIAFVVNSLLGFTTLILAEILIERRLAREPSPGPRLLPWGAGGALLGAIVMLLIARSHPGETSQIPGVQTVLFGTFIGLWAGLALGLGLARRSEH